jgi:hypothetical protein
VTQVVLSKTALIVVEDGRLIRSDPDRGRLK